MYTKSSRDEFQTIDNLNKSIRENKNGGYNLSNRKDHDLFDPNGNVQWGEVSNSGFLTYNRYGKTSQEVQELGLRQEMEEQQIAHAFTISDRQEEADL